jgi:cytochrome c oxidase assembly protein subunit 15
MTDAWTRRLVLAAMALALFVVAASSYLRLAGNGLGCTPWPACYATRESERGFNATLPARALRVLHRFAATAFLLVVIVLVAGSWRNWPARRRYAGAALLLVTGLLAVVGSATPSKLPWITWINVLGGFALVALLAGLWPAKYAVPARWTATAVLLIGLVFAQSLGGALISVRLAGGDCAPACSAAASGDLLALLDPLQPGSAAVVGGAPGAAALLHALHQIGGIALALGALVWVALPSRGSGSARLVAPAAIAVVALGFVLADYPLPALGALHTIAAALLLAGCVFAVRAGTRAAAPIGGES